jgi:hypothetical protein
MAWESFGTTDRLHSIGRPIVIISLSGKQKISEFFQVQKKRSASLRSSDEKIDCTADERRH